MILHRIDAALEKARFRQMEVRAIYLTQEDHTAFHRAMPRFRKYRGFHVRQSVRRSYLFCGHGIEIVIPKSLSPRVQKLAA